VSLHAEQVDTNLTGAWQMRFMCKGCLAVSLLSTLHALQMQDNSFFNTHHVWPAAVIE